MSALHTSLCQVLAFIPFHFCTADYCCLIQMFLPLLPPLINHPWIIPELLLTLREVQTQGFRWQRARKDMYGEGKVSSLNKHHYVP